MFIILPHFLLRLILIFYYLYLQYNYIYQLNFLLYYQAFLIILRWLYQNEKSVFIERIVDLKNSWSWILFQIYLHPFFLAMVWMYQYKLFLIIFYLQFKKYYLINLMPHYLFLFINFTVTAFIIIILITNFKY